MKAIRTFLFAVYLGSLLSACGTALQPGVTPLAESIKGYELYSWQDGKQWNFSLLVGTNREKTISEIKSTDAALLGTDALNAALEKIPAGQYVIWSTKETLSFPSNEIIKQVEQICNDKGLIFTVAK